MSNGIVNHRPSGMMNHLGILNHHHNHLNIHSSSQKVPIATNRDANLRLNFTGLTHDHNPILNNPKEANNSTGKDQLCSVITIVRRHPMYDCLVLVKKYRNCLGGLALEFPIDSIRESEWEPTNEAPQAERPVSMLNNSCCQLSRKGNCSSRRLVSRFLDGDDPVTSLGSPNLITNQNCQHQIKSWQLRWSSEKQLDERGQPCELVYVPINGLLDRLAGYTSQGVSVDGRVYSFAMGLKTAERLMSTKSLLELHETPI